VISMLAAVAVMRWPEVCYERLAVAGKAAIIKKVKYIGLTHRKPAALRSSG